MLTKDDIENMFTYHPPTMLHREKYESIRDAAKLLAMVILISTPSSADQTASIRKLRECVMTANAAIALEEP